MFNQIPSRKERRAFAKKLGLTGKKETLIQYRERIGRAQEFGKQLHLQHLQNQENFRINSEAKLEEGDSKQTRKERLHHHLHELGIDADLLEDAALRSVTTTGNFGSY